MKSSCREVKEDCSESQDNVEVPYGLRPIICPAHREDESSYPGSPHSSFALPRSAPPTRGVHPFWLGISDVLGFWLRSMQQI